MIKKMKKKLTILFVLALIYFLISSAFTGNEGSVLKPLNTVLKPGSTSGESETKDFINCIFNAHYYPDSNGVNLHLGKWVHEISDSLNFNTVHMYGFNTGYEGSVRYGTFGDSLTDQQKVNMLALMDSIGDAGLKGIYGRPNIERLCYAQRLVYEVSQSGGNTTNDGFCYSVIPDSVSQWIASDSGRTVRHCSSGTHNAGYISESIYENLHHNDLYGFVQADTGQWYMKPMMRIDTADFDPNSTTPVVAIIAKRFDGSTLDSVIVKVRNFKNENDLYFGNYIEEFNFSNEPLGTDLIVLGDTINGLGRGINSYPGYWQWNDSDFVDFEVYWFGQVEVWFDKMTVDDWIANELFAGEFDPFIEEEVDEFTSHSTNIAFFADETTCANIPCIKYVKDKMIEYNQSAKLTIATTNYLNVRSMRNDDLAHKRFLQTIQPYMFSNDAHEIPTELPNTLPTPYTGANMVTPEQYNDTLQLVLGHKTAVRRGTSFPRDLPVQGSFIYQVNLARSQRDTYSPDTKFIMQPQIHGFFYETDNGITGMKEPLNEEIQVQAMLSIAHGADGIAWFIFQSYGDSSLTSKRPEPCLDEIDGETTIKAIYGLLTPPTLTPTPRYSNIYGQNKWEYVGEMNSKIEAWKYYLDRTQWTGGYSVHNEGSNNEFIYYIRTRDPDKTGTNPCINPPIESLPGGWYDCPEHTYWEMGFFEPNSTLLPNDNSRYFIMVNRRCIPYDETDTTIGDDRELYVLFESDLPGNFTNWNVIDLENDSIVAKISEGDNEYYKIGEFDPGEGKLYRLVPVMQYGGTLEADETVDANVYCGGMIYNDGYDITINQNKTLSFSEGAGIEMTGGSFFCSSDAGEVINVTFKGLNGSRWNGITLDECDTVGIYCAKFEDVKQNKTGGGSNFALNLIDCYNFKIEKNLFECKQDSAFGGINSVYISEHNDTIISYISENTFDMNNSPSPSVEIISSAGITTPLLLQWNEFSTTCDSSIAIIINSVVGGAIKNNTIEGYNKGINSLSVLSI